MSPVYQRGPPVVTAPWRSAWLCDMQTTAIGDVFSSLRNFPCTCAGSSAGSCSFTPPDHPPWGDKGWSGT